LLSRCSGFSDSEINLSIDLQHKAWLLEVRMTPGVAVGSIGSMADCDKSRLSPNSKIGAWALVPCPEYSATHEIAYRFAWPRINFFTFGFFDPRA
jgi:hypothetical protein